MGGQFSQSLGHQPCLKSHMRISHISLDFCSWDQCRHRVHDNNIYGTGTNHSLCDLQRLLAVVRLRDVQIVDIHTDVLCISRIQGMFRIDKSGNAASLLYLCHHMKGHGSLTAGFRSVDFYDPSLWNTSHSQRNIQAQGTGRYGFYIHVCGRVSQLHDRAFAKLFFNLPESSI